MYNSKVEVWNGAVGMGPHCTYFNKGTSSKYIGASSDILYMWTKQSINR